jgi:hypothetical protein
LVVREGRLCTLRFTANRGVDLHRFGETLGVFAALRLSADQILFADESGLWVLDLEAQRRRPFLPRALPDRIEALGRDGHGRIWGLGERLYLLEPSGRATAFELPFPNPLPRHNWPTSREMAVSGNRIVMPLDERGLLIVDADRTAGTLTRK